MGRPEDMRPSGGDAGLPGMGGAGSARAVGIEPIIRTYSDFDFAKMTPSCGGRGYELSTGLEFFVKPITIPPDSPNERFYPEIMKLYAIEHGSLLHLEGFCESPLTLIYDYHPAGSLHDLLRDQTRLDASRWNNTAKQIVLFGVVEGMWWLHHKRVMHRNLNPSNIILDGNLYPLVGDAGITRVYNRSAAYMAPELLSAAKYKSKIDVWSFGMIAYHVITGTPPFDPSLSFEAIKDAVLSGRLPDIPPDIPSGYDQLIQECLSVDPSSRPTFELILGQFLRDQLLLPNVNREGYHAYRSLIHPMNAEESRVEQLREDAECSDMAAQLEIARSFMRGCGVLMSLKDASRYLVMASELGSPEAQFLYGLLQYRFQKEGAKIVRYIQMAADGGHVNAQILLAKILGDSAQGDHYLQLSLQQKNVVAYLRAGLKVQKVDPVSALKYFKAAADLGSSTAQCLYAVAIHSGNGGVPVDLVEANKYYRMAADQGDLKSACNLAFNLQRGDGCEKDVELANQYYRFAASRGYANAQSNYAYNLMNGLGVERDAAEAMRLYKLAANQGQLSAMYNYGNNLVKGEGVPPDIPTGMELLKVAAERGHLLAQCQYASYLQNYPGVSPDLVQSTRYFKLAADQNNVRAQFNYAVACQKGIGIRTDLQEAAKYFKLAADAGYSFAQNSYAAMLETGSGCPKDVAEANRYYRMAADQGNSNAQVSLAMNLAKGNGIPLNAAECNRYLKLAIEQDNPKAIYQYALHLQKGTGVPADARMANEMFKRAADLGYSIAQFYYGYNLFNGIGIEKNPQEANRYYRLAADQGNANAQCNLACSLLNGIGIEKDLVESSRYYRLSADAGNAVARYNFALHLAGGIGVPENHEEACKYFQKAADQGNLNAMYQLGINYLMGRGVSRSVQQAKKLLKASADGGHSQAKAAMENLAASGDKWVPNH
jgi:TPR repeat protein